MVGGKKAKETVIVAQVGDGMCGSDDNGLSLSAVQEPKN